MKDFEQFMRVWNGPLEKKAREMAEKKGSQTYLKRGLSATKKHCLDQVVGYLERNRKHMRYEISLAVGLETFRVKMGSHFGRRIVEEQR
jgi:hypothetical protein